MCKGHFLLYSFDFARRLFAMRHGHFNYDIAANIYIRCSAFSKRIIIYICLAHNEIQLCNYMYEKCHYSILLLSHNLCMHLKVFRWFQTNGFSPFVIDGYGWSSEKRVRKLPVISICGNRIWNGQFVKVFKIKDPQLFEREQQFANNKECRRRKGKRRDWGDN